MQKEYKFSKGQLLFFYGVTNENFVEQRNRKICTKKYEKPAKNFSPENPPMQPVH